MRFILQDGTKWVAAPVPPVASPVWRCAKMKKPPGGGSFMDGGGARYATMAACPARKEQVKLPAKAIRRVNASWLTAKRSGFSGTMLRCACGRQWMKSVFSKYMCDDGAWPFIAPS